MTRCKAEVVVIPKRRLRSIAVMNIKIQHSNTRQPMRGAGVIVAAMAADENRQKPMGLFRSAW